MHKVYWPDNMPKQAHRDCLATALKEMHGLPPMAALGRAEDWNKCLLVALRALAIVDRFAEMGGVSKRTGKHLDRLQARIASAFGPVVWEQLVEILGNVRSRKTKALRQFSALLRDEDEMPLSGTDKGKGSTGAPSANPMRIIRLPMHCACNSAVRRTSFARSGARLNRPRLARAIATGSTNGLFIRPRYLRGGSYVIDASGSMGLSESRLNELCRAVPAATVAYYSGWSSASADGAYGELVIYAENGRRADYCAHMHGSNDVDLYALLWLLRQPAPRYFVSDGGFCGGPDGQDAQCAALLAGAVATGNVQWIQSVSELEKMLGL